MDFFKKNKKVLLILAVIVLLGSFFRFYRLTDIPPGLNQDEAVTAYDAYSLLSTHKDHHGEYLPLLFESFGDWTSPFLTYFTIPFIKLFGLSVFASRAAVAVLGSLIIIESYVVGYLLTKKHLFGLISALLVSCSGILFHYSRWAIPPSTVPFFTFLLLLCVAIAIFSKRQLLGVVVLSISAGIATYSYPTQKILIPLFLILFCIFFFRKLRWMVIVLVGIYILIVSPLIVKSIQDPKYSTRYLQTSITQVATSEGGYANAFIKRYFNYINPKYLFSKGDPDIRFHPAHTTIIDSSLFIFYLLGIGMCFYLSFKKKRFLRGVDSDFYRFLLAVWFISPLPASITKDDFHLLRFIHSIPLAYVFILIGLYGVYSILRKNIHKKIYIVSISILIIFGFYTFLNTYYSDFEKDARKGFQYGVQPVFEYLIQNESRFKTVIVDDTINKPYIYYLFFSKFDPAKISQKMLTTQHFGQYEFGKVDRRDAEGKKLLQIIRSDHESFYEVYDMGEGKWMVLRMYEN